ncbi:hypothetical protein, partial [Streptomyces sp. NPDC057966]|uniref:hypothetical protein n=1 Tax=Streptomyces sp. NPDC057966 TaxID=3346292 RepID=UPI0036EE4F8B
MDVFVSSSPSLPVSDALSSSLVVVSSSESVRVSVVEVVSEVVVVGAGVVSSSVVFSVLDGVGELVLETRDVHGGAASVSVFVSVDELSYLWGDVRFRTRFVRCDGGVVDVLVSLSPSLPVSDALSSSLVVVSSSESVRVSVVEVVS